MEKGFNDDELADIMNEIESLEQEFVEDSGSNDEPNQEVEEHQAVQVGPEQSGPEVEQPVAATQQSKFSKAPEVDHEMKEVLDELSQMPVEKTVPHAQEQKVHPLKKPSTSSQPSGHTSMQFFVEGNMHMDLGFNIGGQQVKIHVGGHEGLVIELDSGVKFTVPLEAGHSNRKAS